LRSSAYICGFVLKEKGDMADEILAGVAQRVITPPVGVSLAGYFHDRISKTIRDDLYAKCVVLQSGGERVALVTCDLIAGHKIITETARRLVEKETGIKPDHLMVSMTHTHTGPETRPGRIVPIRAEWAEKLPRMIADAVKDAASNVFKAKLHVGRALEPDLATIVCFACATGRRSSGRAATSQRWPVPPARLTPNCWR
jgi:hypothetical protein